MKPRPHTRRSGSRLAALAALGARSALAALAALGTVAALAPIAAAQPQGSPPGAAPSMADAVASAERNVGWQIRIAPPANDDGKHLELTWSKKALTPQGNTIDVVLRRYAEPSEKTAQRAETISDGAGPVISPRFLYPAFSSGHYPGLSDASLQYLSPYDAFAKPLKAGAPLGEWTVIAVAPEGNRVVDEVDPDRRYVYAFFSAVLAEDKKSIISIPKEAAIMDARAPEPAWFDTGRWFFLAFIVGTAAALLIYMKIAKKRGKDLFIRRIAGVDAIEDAVGRSTEMGRPVLYVTGVEQITDLQTIASVLILGKVAELTAEYDTDLKVANAYPMTMVVAEEIVRNGYANAGRLDAHKPENVMFITSEQFAFAAAVNGMILRDRPATNIYLGRFFAESLILSETGFLTGAVQIAGTAEFTQLPFFIAACDYTLIGEELYATSAYLSRDPNQLAQLKAADVMKVICAVLIILGVLGAVTGEFDLIKHLRLD